MRGYAFVFARGGSKGLPKKNIKPLAGKPLIQYSIEAAKQTPEIDKVFVSTEDKQIATVANEAGAIVINRPMELASDDSPEWLSWRHAIEYVNQNYGIFDVFVSLPATSPLRRVSDVTAAINQLICQSADICISITPASRSPYFNMVIKDENSFVNIVNRSNNKVYRRQDSPEVFDMTTVVYAARPSFIINKSEIFEGKVTSIQIPKERAVDIDDIYDFKMAEIILDSKGLLSA